MEEMNDQEMKLPIPDGKISYLRMEPASNGVIISYDLEKKKSPGKGTYDNCSYESKKEVFDVDMNDTQSLDEAFNRYKELWIASYKNK